MQKKQSLARPSSYIPITNSIFTNQVSIVSNRDDQKQLKNVKFKCQLNYNEFYLHRPNSYLIINFNQLCSLMVLTHFPELKSFVLHLKAQRAKVLLISQLRVLIILHLVFYMIKVQSSSTQENRTPIPKSKISCPSHQTNVPCFKSLIIALSSQTVLLI